MILFYRPVNPDTGEMWDTWLYIQDGTFYLFYLARTGDHWDNISLATSPDGVHWHEVGPVLQKGPGVTWMGTGSTWKALGLNPPARYLMNFSEWKGSRQTIFFAASDNLLDWRRLDDSFQFSQDDRWYHPLGRWDCIWTLPREGGGYWGYWTATPFPETGGKFGFGESRDGLIWQSLPPPEVLGGVEGEVGAIEKVSDRYFLMFGSYPNMRVLVAEQPYGPFYNQEKNLLLLSKHTYFSRFFRTPDGLMVNHHSITRDGKVFLGLLKKADVDQEEILRLFWWQGNQKLKDQRNLTSLDPTHRPGTAIEFLAFKPDRKKGYILECEITLPANIYQSRPGVYIEANPKLGSALLVDSMGRVEIFLVKPDGTQSNLEKTIDREIIFKSKGLLRLVIQEQLMEIYLDDVFIACFGLPPGESNRIGIIHGNSPGSIRNIKIWS